MSDVTAQVEGTQPETQQPQPQAQPQVTASVEGTQPPAAAAPTPPPTSGGMFDKVLGALAGHPQTYSVDPNTGKETAAPVTDRGSLAKHIVAAAIVGMLKGVGQRGPGSLGKAAAAGGEAGEQLAQQEDQRARQEPLENYQRQQEAATAKANALAKNLQLRSMQQSLSDQDEKAHQQIVANSADQIARLKAEGNTPEAEGVPEDEAKDPTKHNILDQRIPDGVTPKLGPNGEQEKDADGVPLWQQTYTIFDRHSESSVAGAPWVQQAVDWGIPGAKAVAGMGPNDKLSLPGQNHYIFTLGQLQTMQSELDAFAKKVGTPAPDLKAMVNKDPSLIEAVNQFQRTSGASTQPDLQLDAMRQDPKAAPYAGRIMGMFGADNLEKFKEDRTNQQAAGKAGAEATAKANAEANSPQGRQAAAKNALEIKKYQQDLANGGMSPKDKAEALKIWEPSLDSGERLEVMRQNYKDALKGDQQAMLSLLANHLGMTMGLQKGARLTKDIVHEAQQSRPYLQGLAAKFDKEGYLTGVTLAPEQMRQMVDLGEDRYKLDVQKSRQEAQYIGITQEPQLNTHPAVFASAPGKPRMVSYDNGKTWAPVQ